MTEEIEKDAVQEIVPGEVKNTQDFSSQMAEFRERAEVIIKGGFAPKGMNKPEQVIVAMQIGQELGFGATQSLSVVTVINGTPGVKNEAAVGLLRSRGVLEPGTDVETEYVNDEDGAWMSDEKDTPSNLACIVTMHRKGQAKPFTSKFNVAMARKAGLWNRQGPWRDYPQRMLRWRAIGNMMKDHFSDITLGLPIEQDLRDQPASLRPADPLEKFAPEETGPDPLLESVISGDVDAATEMEILPPLPVRGDTEAEDGVDSGER